VVNNFVTSFEYVNENNTLNSSSYINNSTTYSFDDSKKLSYSTRINKRTKMTEFYNLMYQYRNDCLTASLEYSKDYYSDRDLTPNENIFFKLSIIPFGQISSPSLK
jgi:LPS-assembly protein